MSQLKTTVTTEDGRLYIGRSQDCTPIAEHAKALHNEGLHGSSDMRLAAEIPYVIAEKYCNDRGIGFPEFMADPKHIKAICNDPDNKMFRVWPGQL